jgi:hypothetical protein
MKGEKGNKIIAYSPYKLKKSRSVATKRAAAAL